MSSFANHSMREPSPARQRSGFALPLAIMVLALLTIGLVAGFAMSTSEQSSTSSQRAQARAYSYAQMGLEKFLTYRKELTGCTPAANGYSATQASACAFCPQCWLVNAANPTGTVNANLDTLPTVAESVTVKFTSGSAFVRAVPVYLDIAKGKGTYFITSTGTDSLSKIATGGGTTRLATRTVGVYVKWDKTTMNVMGALVSFAGINKAGTGDISGIDACGADTNVAGINIPLDVGMSVSGNSFTPTGNPPYDTLKTFSQDSANSKLDWAGVKSGTSLTADIDVTVSSYPNFPAASVFAADTNYWPVIHIRNRQSGSGWNCGNGPAAATASTARARIAANAQAVLIMGELLQHVARAFQARVRGGPERAALQELNLSPLPSPSLDPAREMATAAPIVSRAPR